MLVPLLLSLSLPTKRKGGDAGGAHTLEALRVKKRGSAPPLWARRARGPPGMATADSQKLEYGFRVICAGVPSFFCFGIRGLSYSNSNSLASKVRGILKHASPRCSAGDSPSYHRLLRYPLLYHPHPKIRPEYSFS